MPNRNVPRCTALETGVPGPATFGFPAPERVPACGRIQWSRHFALVEEASSPYGATDRGRSSCPNQASHGSIRYASATRVRSNAPGRCSNCLKQRPTRLREYPSCYPHATSGHTALQWALTYFEVSMGTQEFVKVRAAVCDKKRRVRRRSTGSLGLFFGYFAVKLLGWMASSHCTRGRHRVMWRSACSSSWRGYGDGHGHGGSLVRAASGTERRIGAGFDALQHPALHGEPGRPGRCCRHVLDGVIGLRRK